MYLDDIISWLENTIKKYTAQSEDSTEKNKISTQVNSEKDSELEELTEFIEIFEFPEKIIDRFYLSVLSGEYLVDESYDEKLERINKLIGDSGGISPENIELINSIKQIRSLITQYRHFILRINTKYSKPERIELFNTFTDRDDSYFYETSNDEIDIKCGLFKDIILGITYYDHNLSLKVDQDSFKEILYFLSRISETKEVTGPVKALSEAKCKILLYKLAKRIEQDDKKYYYTHNLSDKEFEIKDNIPVYYKDFIDDIDLQYYDDFENNKDQNRFVKYCNKILEVSNSELALTDAHALVKYHKDVLQNGEDVLKDLCEKLKQTSSKSNFKCDQRAKTVSYHYLLNNHFSYIVNKCEENHTKIINELKEIVQRQKVDDVENYFPFLRYTEYLISTLDQEFSNDIIDSSTIKIFLEAFEENYKILMNKYEWCYDRDFLAYMPSYNECIKIEKIEGHEYKLFIASAFVLPINYAQVKRQIDELFQRFTKYKLLFDVKLFQDKKNQELENTIDKVTREFSNIEERVKDSERKNIEILGIFAAIVLFTMSNIQIFSKIDYVKDAILFMLIMAYCMCMFIVVIWLITRDKGYFGKDDDYRAIINKTPSLHKVIIGLLIIATLISLIYTAPYFNSIKSDSRERKFELIHSQIDSIQEQSKNRDSIIKNLKKDLSNRNQDAKQKVK